MSNWISSIHSVAWVSIFYIVSTVALSLVRQDNPVIPITLSTRGKWMLITGLGLIQTVLHTEMGGVPWTQAIIEAITSQGAALGGHGWRDTVSMPPAGGVVVPATESTPAVVVPTVPAAPTSFRIMFNLSPTMRLAMTFGTIATIFGLACVLLQPGCTAAQGAADLKIAECIVSQYDADIQAGMSPQNAAAATALYCVVSELTVEKTMAETKAARAERHALSVSDGTPAH